MESETPMWGTKCLPKFLDKSQKLLAELEKLMLEQCRAEGLKVQSETKGVAVGDGESKAWSSLSEHAEKASWDAIVKAAKVSLLPQPQSIIDGAIDSLRKALFPNLTAEEGPLADRQNGVFFFFFSWGVGEVPNQKQHKGSDFG